MNKRTTGVRLLNHCSSGKVISVTYSEAMSEALVIKHANRMRLIFICGLSGSIPYFSTLFLKRRDFRKNMLLKVQRRLCVDFLYNYCLKHFSF
jgi:hypothetical protein